jgi:endonuclease YncB( thermonuclease family)
MARPAAKSTVKAPPAAVEAEAVPAKDNRGRELLELRIRWKIINEMVEAGLAERKKLAV